MPAPPSPHSTHSPRGQIRCDEVYLNLAPRDYSAESPKKDSTARLTQSATNRVAGGKANENAARAKASRLPKPCARYLLK